MSWSELPAEILYAIFKYLDSTESTGQCQYACKNWSIPAQHALYEKLWFVGKNREQCAKFLNCMKSHPNNRGQLVKAVHFGFSYNQRFCDTTRSYLLELAKVCPNIEDVNAFSPIPAFYKELACASIFYWKHLKGIPRPYLMCFEPIDYSICVFQSQNSLQQVSISKNFCLNEFGRDFLEKLNEFPCLKKVSVMDPVKPNQLDDILQRLPRVNVLSLVNVDDLDGFKYEGSSVVPCEQIKSIEGVSLVFDEDILNYFMEKFPKLKYLEMSISFSGYFTSSDYYGDPSQLLTYIHDIPKYNIRMILPTADLIRSILKQLEPTMFSLYLDHQKIQVTQKNSEGSTMTLVYTKPNETIIRYFGNQIKDVTPTNITDIQVIKILEQCGANLWWLRLDITSHARSFESPLRDVFRLCPKLKRLHCTAKTLYKLSPDDAKYMQASSIESLSLDAEMALEDAFLQLSVLLPSLKRLKVNINTLLHYQKNECFTLDMPSTTFEYLYLCLREPPFNKGLNGMKSQESIIIKILCKSVSGKVYKLNGSFIEEYPNPSASPDVFIRCQDIQTISLKLGEQFVSFSLKQ
ncbi:hypothetical protein G6F43_004077 [Rhizopus delemar]|nr:hypothetical protein G6F43_004077 [Rhizopus delemar]